MCTRFQFLWSIPLSILQYIAQMLLRINERGTWSDPPPTDATALAKQDEEIFQIVRLVKCVIRAILSCIPNQLILTTYCLVSCGHFRSLIIGDYVAGFLGSSGKSYICSISPYSHHCHIHCAEGIVTPLLNGAFSPLRLESQYRGDRGTSVVLSLMSCIGCVVPPDLILPPADNTCAAQWHTVLSQADEQWTEQLFGKVFGTSKPFDQLTLSDFMMAFTSVMANIPTDPRQRTFGQSTPKPPYSNPLFKTCSADNHIVLAQAVSPAAQTVASPTVTWCASCKTQPRLLLVPSACAGSPPYCP
jgi:hypothetical protein